MLDHAGFFRIFWEHSRRALGRRARGPATTPDFRPFCARGLSQRCRLRHDGIARSAERSPRTDAGLVQGATDGQHGRHRAKGCPQIGSLQRYTTSAGPCSPPRARRRRLPAENIVSARVLLRCHCAATSDSLRCDARSTRRAAGTRAPPQNTHDVRTACAFWMRGEASRRGPAPVLGVFQAATRSRRARVRVRVRVSQGPSLPRPVFRYTTERAGRLGGARPTD